MFISTSCFSRETYNGKNYASRRGPRLPIFTYQQLSRYGNCENEARGSRSEAALKFVRIYGMRICGAWMLWVCVGAHVCYMGTWVLGGYIFGIL